MHRFLVGLGIRIISEMTRTEPFTAKSLNDMANLDAQSVPYVTCP